MAEIVMFLNGTNYTKEVGVQSIPSTILSEGVRKNFSDELEVTTGEVAAGMCFVEVTRDNLTPNETFLIPFWNTTTKVVSTSGDGWIIVRIDKDKVNDGSGNEEDGTDIGVIEKVASLPVDDPYLILATLSGGVITDARTWAQLSEDVIDNPIYYDEDEEANDSYVISISGVKEYIDGKEYTFKANTTNVGSATLNINGLGAKAIRKQFNATLSNSDILAGQIVTVRYDADQDSFQLMSTPSSIVSLSKASQAEAEAGTDDAAYMTPYKTFSALGRRLLTFGATIPALVPVMINSAGKAIEIPWNALSERMILSKQYASESSGEKAYSKLAARLNNLFFFTFSLTDSGGDNTIDAIAIRENPDGSFSFFGQDYWNGLTGAYVFSYLFRVGGDGSTVRTMTPDEDSNIIWFTNSNRNDSGDLDLNVVTPNLLKQTIGSTSAAAYPDSSGIDTAKVERTSIANTAILLARGTGINQYRVAILSGTITLRGAQTYPSTLSASISNSYDTLQGYPVFMSGGIARVATAVDPATGIVTWGDASDTIASVTTQGGACFSPDDNYHLFTYTKSSVLKGRLGRITGGKIVWAGTEQTIINANKSTDNGNITYSKAHAGWLVTVEGVSALVRVVSGDISVTAITLDSNSICDQVIASKDYPEHIFTLNNGTTTDIVYVKSAKYLGTNMKDYVGITQESGSLDQSKLVTLAGGIANGYTGLTPGKKYYYGGAEIGTIISATQIKLYDRILD